MNARLGVFVRTLTAGVETVPDSFACAWDPFSPPTGSPSLDMRILIICFALSDCDLLCHPCSVVILERPALFFFRETEKEWVCGEGREDLVGDRSRGRCGWDVMYVKNKNSNKIRSSFPLTY